VAEAHALLQVTMLADPTAAFTRALGEDMLVRPSDQFGELRCRRFAAIVDHGRFAAVQLEPAGDATCSRAESIEALL
jgi:peroxiredoxin